VAEWAEIQMSAPKEELEYWLMYFDGSLNIKGGGVGILFISPKVEVLKYVQQVMFPVSNNAAKNEAVLHGLQATISRAIK